MNRRKFLQAIGISPVSLVRPVKQELPNPPHNSLQTARLNRMPERIYAEAWKEKNKRHSWLNSGFTYLEWILCPGKNYVPPLVSERDAQVAASVIQWLGTNCGFHFMLDCETEIKKEERKHK